MLQGKWKDKYIKCQMRRTGVTRQEAENFFTALNKNDINYNQDPESLVLEELSYWYD